MKIEKTLQKKETQNRDASRRITRDKSTIQRRITSTLHGNEQKCRAWCDSSRNQTCLSAKWTLERKMYAPESEPLTVLSFWELGYSAVAHGKCCLLVTAVSTWKRVVDYYEEITNMNILNGGKLQIFYTILYPQQLLKFSGNDKNTEK